MPPRPFPFAMRVGTDIVSIERIQNAITRKNKNGDGTQLIPFLNKMLTRREQQIFNRTFPDFTVADELRLRRVSTHLAGRWAAKEAVIKAAKPRKLVYLDVEVLPQEKTSELYGLIRDNTFVHKTFGIKRLTLTDDTAEGGTSAAETATEKPLTAPRKLVKENDHDPAGQMVVLNISHEMGYATAVCIAPLGQLPGDVGGEAAARMYDATESDAGYSKQ